jgi:hypothetical protein
MSLLTIVPVFQSLTQFCCLAIWKTTLLQGSWHKIFDFRFFSWIFSLAGPLSILLGPFKFCRKIRGDIHNFVFIPGVNDVGDKLFIGVNNTGDKNQNNKLIFLTPNHLPRKTLWCKNQENPSDRKSHTWAPLTWTFEYVHEFSWKFEKAPWHMQGRKLIHEKTCFRKSIVRLPF